MKDSMVRNNKTKKAITRASILMLVALVTAFFVFFSIESNKKKIINTEYNIVQEKVIFDTKRLLVNKSNYDKEIAIKENAKIISEYEDLYLIEYESKEEAKDDYSKLKEMDYYTVESDIEISIADDTEKNNNNTIVYNSANNPFNYLNGEYTSYSDEYVIALIDTGASENENVIERVSVIGDSVDDDNGHGNKMVKNIVSQDSNAKILSIKALDQNGKGTISSVYAAVEYATKRGVKVINLSLSAYSGGENRILEIAINKANDNGIIVVGSAGNNNSDANYYVPANCDAALIVGSCDKNGNRRDFSNIGISVDYNVVSDSTSEACSLMTGYISRNNLSKENLEQALEEIKNTKLIYEVKNKEEREGIVEDKEVNFSAQAISNIGDYEEYGAANSIYTFTAPYTGVYKLETWGAQGGRSGGKGGYAKGEIKLTKNQKLYVGVGKTTSNSTGGYNGGGNAVQRGSTVNTYAGGGGGATHIAKTTNRGVLSNYSSNKSEVLIVGGGGGGKAENGNAGGYGGGTNGGNGTGHSTYTGYDYYGCGGTQTSGGNGGQLNNDPPQRGSFGKGGYGVTSSENEHWEENIMYGGGGGAGYYGGGAGDWSQQSVNEPAAGGGGGGSGYTGGVTNASMTSNSRTGDGRALITLLSIECNVTYKPNGGTGSDISEVINYGDSFTIKPYNTFSREGYHCIGYSEEADATTPSWTIDNSTNWTWTYKKDVILYAVWEANTATVTIKKDNSNWSSSGINVALYQSNTAKYTYANATKTGATVSWSTVAAGTYDVYASKNSGALTTLVDTGIDVVVSSTGTATIDFYTLTLNKGVGISAVSGAGTYLKNQAANIDATVSTGYTWEGWSVTSGDSPD